MNFSDVMIPIVKEKPTLFDKLNGEADHRSMVGLLAILVLLLHLWVIVWLLQPTEPVVLAKPPKVMEVALLSAPSPKPAAASPAAPPKPAPPKKVQPKKPTVKQPVKRKTPIARKSTELPKPQPVIEEPLPVSPPLSDSAQKTEPPTSEPQLAINQPSKPAEKIGTAETDTKTVVSDVMPLMRVPPKYPTRAANRHIEGWVKIEFTISTTGTVTDAIVVDAEPADVFDNAALKAIEKWKFKEKLVNGIAVTQRAVQVLKFKLSK